MKKPKLGRPKKKRSEKMIRRITVPLTDRDFADLIRYEKASGKGGHARTVRELFLQALRRLLPKAGMA